MSLIRRFVLVAMFALLAVFSFGKMKAIAAVPSSPTHQTPAATAEPDDDGDKEKDDDDDDDKEEKKDK